MERESPILKPFIILALPRSGTKMVARSLSTHPDIPDIVHEFRGTPQEYWRHPYALSNFLKPWMLDERILKVHLFREDVVAGARSILTMGYHFPDGVQELELWRVERAAKERKEIIQRMESACDWSVSYEELTNNGEEIKLLPQWFVDKFCKSIGVKPRHIHVPFGKNPTVTLKNEDEIKCLAV